MEASPAVVETPPSGCWVIERPRRSGAEGSGKQGTEGQQADDGRQGAEGRGSRVVEGEEDSRIWGVGERGTKGQDMLVIGLSGSLEHRPRSNLPVWFHPRQLP